VTYAKAVCDTQHRLPVRVYTKLLPTAPTYVPSEKYTHHASKLHMPPTWWSGMTASPPTRAGC
jgi:hypothetical protein